ncbi:hypothetical protein [Methylobacterium isbiliense]|jgi:hypothetical protein|uniref:Uncharacterized protein n=1 Tax=Methylobacterium isbiliense TaxID=315478 RepID=A0ABQ4SCD9_9HYPH|nr:hypothetical protein [Methylobacterium isbiliense]MDN3621560.1 hypothetical protein [Methylobacterium isbiliense]GJE00797.1 hypothetical protein GMJLKIPL_2724 [Methylobacterium isbiliense]
MTFEGAVAAIVALVGGGGITSIAVAYLGYKTEAARGRKILDGEAPAIAVGGAMAAKSDLEALTNALTSLTILVGKLVEMTERQMRDRAEREHKREIEDAALRVLREEMAEQAKREGITPTPRPGHRDPRR